MKFDCMLTVTIKADRGSKRSTRHKDTAYRDDRGSRHKSDRERERPRESERRRRDREVDSGSQGDGRSQPEGQERVRLHLTLHTFSDHLHPLTSRQTHPVLLSHPSEANMLQSHHLLHEPWQILQPDLPGAISMLCEGTPGRVDGLGVIAGLQQVVIPVGAQPIVLKALVIPLMAYAPATINPLALATLLEVYLEMSLRLSMAIEGAHFPEMRLVLMKIQGRGLSQVRLLTNRKQDFAHIQISRPRARQRRR